MIIFKNFTKLNRTELELVFAWRIDKRVNAYFINEFVEFNEHFAFAKSLENDKSKRYFLVFEDENPIGVVNFVGISEDECELGIYQNPNLKGKGRILLENLAHYAFETLNVKRLKARTRNENERAKRLFLGFGFVLTHQDEAMSHFVLNASNFASAQGGGGGEFCTSCK